MTKNNTNSKEEIISGNYNFIHDTVNLTDDVLFLYLFGPHPRNQ